MAHHQRQIVPRRHLGARLRIRRRRRLRATKTPRGRREDVPGPRLRVETRLLHHPFRNAVVVENRLAVLVQFGFERGVPVLVENRFAVLVHLGDVFGDVLVRIPLRPPRARVVGALPRGAVRGAARDVSVGVQNLDGAVGEVPRRRAVGKHDATRLLRETRRVQNRPAPAPGGVRSARGDALHHAPLGGDRDAQTRRRGVLREDWFTRRGLGLGRRLVRRVSLLVQHGLAVLAQHGHGRRLLHHPSRGAVVVENRLAVLV